MLVYKLCCHGLPFPYLPYLFEFCPTCSPTSNKLETHVQSEVSTFTFLMRDKLSSMMLIIRIVHLFTPFLVSIKNKYSTQSFIFVCFLSRKTHDYIKNLSFKPRTHNLSHIPSIVFNNNNFMGAFIHLKGMVIYWKKIRFIILC